MSTVPRDPRAIITPDAFAVAPHLLGLPLARPARRAGAMLLDLILVSIMIRSIGGIFLPVLGGVMLVRVLRPSKTGGLLRRGAVFAIGFVAALLIIGSVLNAWSDMMRELSDNDTAPIQASDTIGDPEAAQALREAAAGAAEESDSTRADAAAADGPRGIRRLVAAAGDDLGLGFGWLALYFTAFGVIGRGQTPGKRALGIRIIRLDGRPISWWISFERFGGYAASFSTGLLGFLQILWDRNRQGLHDKAVETVVIRVSGDGTALYRRPPL